MNSQTESHLFWGIHSPLTSLTGLVLLVIASGRIAFALIAAVALLWVYAFSMAAARLGLAALPRQGRNTVLLFVSSFFSCVFFVLLWMLAPALAMECTLIIFLVPVVFTASGLCARVVEYDMLEVLTQAMAEALIMGTLILGLALIREPLGFGSISIPGFDIIRFVREEPLRFFQASSGALILLGYGIAFYRHHRNQYTNSEDD